MPSSIVLELQREALSREVAVADLLRKALAVAVKLRLEEIQSWIRNELEGYPDVGSVPSYRKLSGEVKAMNPVRGWIPVVFGDEEVAKLMSTRSCIDSVAALQGLLENREKGGVLTMALPARTERRLAKHSEFEFETKFLFGHNQVAAILDAVRNTVLNWTLQLEQDGILGEGFSFSATEQRAAATSAGYHQVNNFYAPVAQSQFAQGARQNALQTNESPLDTTELLAAVRAVRDALDQLQLSEPTRAELVAELTTIETQAQSPKPKLAILQESGRTVRTIIEGAAGNVVGAGLVDLWGRLPV